jgi:hypothetical protein
MLPDLRITIFQILPFSFAQKSRHRSKWRPFGARPQNNYECLSNNGEVKFGVSKTSPSNYYHFWTS